MSRIGTQTVTLPKGVELKISGRDITVKGPKGELDYTIPMGIDLSQEEGVVSVGRQKSDKQSRAYHGLTRALLNNMVIGVSEGFKKSLRIEGVGYRAAMKGKSLEVNVGYSNPVLYPIPDGIEIEVEDPTNLHIKGIDKQKVGQVAAEIRKIRPPEPYKGKGIRYADEIVQRKAGKAAA